MQILLSNWLTGSIKRNCAFNNDRRTSNMQVKDTRTKMNRCGTKIDGISVRRRPAERQKNIKKDSFEEKLISKET